MNFVKNSPEYIVIYSRRQAIEMLKEDKRVATAIMTSDGMEVISSPIVPKGYTEPVGTYRIVLEKSDKYLSISIKRVEGTAYCDGTRLEQYHIQPGYGGGTESDNVCWGNLAGRVDKMKEKKDWFWLAKSCLDLICDWKREVTDNGDRKSGETSKRYIKALSTQYKEYHRGEKKK